MFLDGLDREFYNVFRSHRDLVGLKHFHQPCLSRQSCGGSIAGDYCAGGNLVLTCHDAFDPAFSIMRSSTLASVMSEAPAFSACSASHLSNLARLAVKLPSGSLDSYSTVKALSSVMNVRPSFRTNRSIGASFQASPRSLLTP